MVRPPGEAARSGRLNSEKSEPDNDGSDREHDGDFTVEAASRALARHQRFHHQVRPHQALDCMTPDEYLRNNKENHPQSRM